MSEDIELIKLYAEALDTGHLKLATYGTKEQLIAVLRNGQKDPFHTDNVDQKWMNLFKCPLCKQDLYAYSIMGLAKTKNTYCPKCNITRFSIMSGPYLCSKCFSKDFYEKEGKQICWFCGNDNFISINYEEAKKRDLFETEGYLLSQNISKSTSKCKHQHSNNKRHNENIFKFVCEDCGDIEYIFIPKWMQEKYNIKDTILDD